MGIFFVAHCLAHHTAACNCKTKLPNSGQLRATVETARPLDLQISAAIVSSTGMIIAVYTDYVARLRSFNLPAHWLACSSLVICCWFCATAVVAAEPTGAEPELKYEEPRSLTGAIYERGPDRSKLLFRFKRQATRSGSNLKVVRDYTYPDGKLAVQEMVVYQGDNLVSLTLREVQIGAEGGARIRRSTSPNSEGTIQFDYVKSPGSARKERSEALRNNTLIGDMIGPFLADHWAALMRGEKLRTRYIAVPRMETAGFTFVKDAATDPKNPRAVLIKMEPTSRIIAAIVDPLFFSLEKAPPHRILEYNGRTSPKLNIRGKWEDLDAITVFGWK